MARPRKYNISLTDDEVKKLKSIMHKKQTSKTVRNRCQIILDLDDAHGKVLTHEQSRQNKLCMYGYYYEYCKALFRKRHSGYRYLKP